MTAVIAAITAVAWYTLGLAIFRPMFRRAMIRGIATARERWPSLYPDVTRARREWMSIDGSLLLIGCFFGAPVWPLVLLVARVLAPLARVLFLGPVPAERAERIARLERELGLTDSNQS